MAYGDAGGDVLDPGPIPQPPDPAATDASFAAQFDQPAPEPVQSPDAISRNFAAAVAPSTVRPVNDVAPVDTGSYTPPPQYAPVPFEVPYGPLARAYGHGGSQENTVAGLDVQNPAFAQQQSDAPPTGREMGTDPQFFYSGGELRGIKHPLGALDPASEAAGIAAGHRFAAGVTGAAGAVSDAFNAPWEAFLGAAATIGTPQQVMVDAAVQQRLAAEHIDPNSPEGVARGAQIRFGIARQVWEEGSKANPMLAGAISLANPLYLFGGGLARAAGLGRVPVIGKLLESTVANAGMPGIDRVIGGATDLAHAALGTNLGRVGAAVGAAAIGAELASNEDLRRELAGQAPMAALLVLGILKKDVSLDRTVLGDLMKQKAVREAVVAYEKTGTAEDAAAVAKAVHDAAPSKSKAIYGAPTGPYRENPTGRSNMPDVQLAPAYVEKVQAGWRLAEDPAHGAYWVKPDGRPAGPNEKPVPTETPKVEPPPDSLAAKVAAAESPLAARVATPGPLGARLRAAKSTPAERALEAAGGTSAATERTNAKLTEAQKQAKYEAATTKGMGEAIDKGLIGGGKPKARLGKNVVPAGEKPPVEMVPAKPRLGKNTIPVESKTPPVTRKVTDTAGVERARAVAQDKANAAKPVPPKMTKVIERAKQAKYTGQLRESIGKTLIVTPEMTAEDIVRGAGKQLQEALRKGGASNLDVRAQRVLAEQLLAEEANRNHVIAVQEARKAGVQAEYNGPPTPGATPTTYHIVEPSKPGGPFRVVDDRGIELPIGFGSREAAQKAVDQRTAAAQARAGKPTTAAAGDAGTPPERPPTTTGATPPGGERMGPPGQLALPAPTKETLRIHNAKVKATAKMEAQAARQADLEALRLAKRRAQLRAQAARDAAKQPIPLGPPGTPVAEPKQPIGSYLRHHPGEIINFPRALRATADVSVLARQALIPLIANALSFSAERRIISRDTIIAAFKGYGKEYANELYVQIQKDPMFKLAMDDGLALGHIGGGGQAHNREEFFQSPLAERLPVLGGLVQGAERSYTSALNVTRFYTYREGVLARERVGRSMSPDERAVFVRFINAATGRGTLGKYEGSIPLLNALFFAPRFAVSRFQTFVEPVRALKEGHAELAMREATDLVKFVGAGVAMLALAKGAGFEVGADPTSSDFGKIKIGDTRIDIWGGFVQPAVLIGRLIQDQTTSSVSGKTHSLSQAKFGQSDAQDVEWNFLLSKVNPTTQTIMALIRSKDTNSQPFGPRGGHDLLTSATDVFGNTAIPLSWQDIASAVVNDYQTGVSAKRGIPIPVIGAAAGVASLAGVGVQTYDQTGKAAKKPLPRTPISPAEGPAAPVPTGPATAPSQRPAPTKSAAGAWF